jgi:hypothetical protein
MTPITDTPQRRLRTLAHDLVDSPARSQMAGSGPGHKLPTERPMAEFRSAARS